MRTFTDDELTFRTANYVLRPMTDSDARGEFRRWLGMPDIMHPLNLPARDVPVAECERYIGAFDRAARFLFCVETPGGEFRGFWIVTRDASNATANVQMTSGVPTPEAKAVLLESTLTVGDWLFDTGAEKVVAHVVSTNRRTLEFVRATGYPEEGLLRGEMPNRATRRGRIDIHRFGMLAEDWRKTRPRMEAMLRGQE